MPLSWWGMFLIILFFFMAILILLIIVNVPKKHQIRGALRYNSAEVKVRAVGDGNIVSCNVKNGEMVERGVVLISIERDETLASGVSASKRQIELIKSELKLFHGELGDLSTEGELEILQLEQKRESLIIKRRITREKLLLSSKQIAEARKSKNLAEDFFNEGIITEYEKQIKIDRLFTLENGMLQLEENVNEIQSEISSIDFRLRSLPFEQSNKYNELSRKISELERLLVQIESARSYALNSPTNGQITGSVCREGERVDQNKTLMIVKPNGSKLIGEMTVPSSIVRSINVGQIIPIRYDSFPFQKYGIFAARIEELSEIKGISTDELQAVSGAEGYGYRVVLTPIWDNGNAPDKFRRTFKSGMEFTAEIEVENRRLIDWIFPKVSSIFQ